MKPRVTRALLAAAAVLAWCRCNTPPNEATSPATARPGAPERVRESAARDGTWGEPDRQKVQRLMRQHAAEVRRCYESALAQDARARGKVTLRFTIAEGGGVEEVAVTRSTFARRDVPNCIASLARTWKTPFRPAEPVEVEYPFSFSPR